jgi:cytosine/adenosine deaminase-related metal-dependent hydrolase
VVRPDGTAPERWILVEEGKIAALSEERPPVAEDALVVETGPDDWIFPGLLDLHTHSTYNLLPLWDAPLAPFDNRFAWRADAGYLREVKDVYQRFDPRNNEEFRDVLAVAAELQAVAGGTTVLQEDTDLDRGLGDEHSLVLCRDTAKPADLLDAGSQTILSVLELFRPGDDGEPQEQWGLDRYRNDSRRTADGERLQATLVHLAEGRSGFGHHRGPDPYCRREFEALRRHPAFADADAVRRSRLAIVHGSGIDVTDPEHLDFLVERGISIVWSPVSNLLLYGDTLDVETLLDAGVEVALGSDWSPSGSKHVWDEAKFARFWLDAIGSSVSDAQVFRMATSAAGRCLGLPRLGRLELGGLADFFILRCRRDTGNPFEVFFSTSDRHVRATLIGGRPIYGDADFLAGFGVETQPLPAVEGSAVAGKAVHLPRRLGVDLDRDLGRFEAFLKGLPEPVQRSNLLSSSDKIYRRRIQELKGSVTLLGWSVQQWRARGPSRTPGKVPPAGRGRHRPSLTTDRR